MHSIHSSEGHARQMRTSRGLRIAGVAAVLAAFVPALLPGASAGGSPEIVGSLSRFPADVARSVGVKDLKAASEATTDGGVAMVYPKLDRLYQLWNLTDGPQAGSLVIAERDRGSLSLGRVAVIPDRAAEFVNGDEGAEWAATFDNAGDRLYVMYRARGGAIGYTQAPAGRNLPGFIGLDLKSFAWTDSALPRLTAETAGAALITVGMEYEEKTDTLLLLQVAEFTTSGSVNNVGIIGFKGDALRRGGELSPSAPRTVRACRRDPINNRAIRYFTPILVAAAPDPEDGGRVKDYVIFPCYSTSASANVVLAKIALSSALDPTSRQEKAIVAPSALLNWGVDTTHGRMYLTNEASETDTWVYEAWSNAFVGIIEMSPKGGNVGQGLSMGVDEINGRLFARALGNGLMVSTATLDPVPQADTYPHLAAPGSFRILPDEKRNRVFSLAGSSTGVGQVADAYEIIQVPAPVGVQARPDPDKRTAQIPEAPGKTVAQYGGTASAYGLRVLLARGIAGAVPSNGNADAGSVFSNVNSYCGFGDREMVLAGIGSTELNDLSKFARAAAVSFDNATTVDLKLPSRCDIYNSYNGPFYPITAIAPFLQTTGVLTTLDSKTPPGAQPSALINENIGPKTAWDYQPADCTSPDGKARSGPNSAALAGPTKVECDLANEIKASAEGHAREVDGTGITVARATSSTSVRLDPVKGLVSKAESKVEGLRIGSITIGYLKSTAVSYAKGRKGTAFTEYPTPEIGYIEGPGIPRCATGCNLDAVIAQLNNALSGRMEFRRPPPQADLVTGSPGGYEAGVLKSQKQKASDNSLSGDSSVEIPALEVVVYNDNPAIGRARQVFQFAGVRVDSHYGIQPIDDSLSALGAEVLDDGQLPDVGTEVAPPPVAGITAPPENPITRFFRQAVAGVLNGLRILFANPREALLMATVWGLLAAPFMAARRRRALQVMNRASSSPTRGSSAS